MNEHIGYRINGALNSSSAQDIEDLLTPFFDTKTHPYPLESFLDDLEKMNFDEINELCNSIGPVGVHSLQTLLTAAMTRYDDQ